MDNFWPYWMFWVIFWVIFSVVMSRIGWGRHGRRWDKPVDKSAMDILKERYAKGEINKQEFDDKKRDIS